MGFSVPILPDLPRRQRRQLLTAVPANGDEQVHRQALVNYVRKLERHFVIGVLAYVGLRGFTKLRKVDAAAVAGYYGSDSAGTFVTCVGVLAAANIAYAAYIGRPQARWHAGSVS